MFDLMSFLGAGQQQPQPPQAALPTSEARPPELANQWQTYLSDPNIRAAMLSAGLAMMRPSWGGTGQQIVSGIGAGAETLGDRQQAQMALDRQAKNDAEQAAERTDRRTDKALDRENSLEIAKMNNDTRLSLGNLRAGPGGTGASKGLPALYQKVLKEEYDRLKDPITGELPEGMLPEEAAISAQSRAEARLSQANQFLASNNGVPGASPNSTGTGKAPATTQKSPSQMNSPVEKQFKNKATGKLESFILKDGQWVKK